MGAWRPTVGSVGLVVLIISSTGFGVGMGPPSAVQPAADVTIPPASDGVFHMWPRSHAAMLSVEFQCGTTRDHGQAYSLVTVGECTFLLLSYQAEATEQVLDLLVWSEDRLEETIGIRSGNVAVGVGVSLPPATPLRVRANISWDQPAGQAWFVGGEVRGFGIQTEVLTSQAIARHVEGTTILPTSVPRTPSGSIQSLIIGYDRWYRSEDILDTILRVEVGLDSRQHVELIGRTVLTDPQFDIQASLPGGGTSLQIMGRGFIMEALQAPEHLSVTGSWGAFRIRHDAPALHGYARGSFGEIGFTNLPQEIEVQRDDKITQETCTGERERRDKLEIHASAGILPATVRWTDPDFPDRHGTDENVGIHAVVRAFRKANLTLDTNEQRYAGDISFEGQEGSVLLDAAGTFFEEESCAEKSFALKVDGTGIGVLTFDFAKEGTPRLQAGANLRPGGEVDGQAWFSWLSVLGLSPSIDFGISHPGLDLCVPGEPYRLQHAFAPDACVPEGACRDVHHWTIHTSRFCALGGR